MSVAILAQGGGRRPPPWPNLRSHFGSSCSQSLRGLGLASRQVAMSLGGTEYWHGGIAKSWRATWPTTAPFGHGGGPRLGENQRGVGVPHGQRQPYLGIAAAHAFGVNMRGGVPHGRRRPLMGIAAALAFGENLRVLRGLYGGSSAAFLGESVLAQLGIGLGDWCGRGSCGSVVGGFRTSDYPRGAWTSSGGSADDPGTWRRGRRLRGPRLSRVPWRPAPMCVRCRTRR